MDDIKLLAQKIDEFATKRDWGQFHSPKNLAMALSVEAGELLEQFQWLTISQSDTLTNDKLKKVKDELADVFIYLVRLSSRLGIDLVVAANEKITKNEIKYPVEKAKGNATKYTEL